MSATTIPDGMPPLARLAAQAELGSIRLVEARLEVWPGAFEGDAEADVRVKVVHEHEDDRLTVLVGVWLRLIPLGADIDRLDEEEVPVLLSVIAEHVATYDLPAGFTVSDAEYEAYADQVGLLGIWPFAREVIQGLAAKAGFADVTLPIRKAMLDGPPVTEALPAKKAPAKKQPAKKAPAKKVAAKKAPAKKKSVRKVGTRQTRPSR